MEARNFKGRTVKIRGPPVDFLVDSVGGSGLTENGVTGSSSFREALLHICASSKEGASSNVLENKLSHMSSVLNAISKQLEKAGGSQNISNQLLDLFICLRIPLINESKSVRTATLRIIRLCLHDQDSIQKLLGAHLHHFIAKCFDVLVDNVAERTQALRLCRRLLLVEPNLYPVALARSVVALAQDGGKEKDRLVRASLAHLAELCVVNPDVFVASGGVRCFSSAVLDCPSPRMQEAMTACLLYLLDTKNRRLSSCLNLRFLVAPYSDYHYKHYTETGGAGQDANAPPAILAAAEDREMRLGCAKQALLSVLRSWSGLLHAVSCSILDDLVRVLLPCHLETRKAMLEFFYTLLRLPLPEWTDEFSVALLATDPSRIQDAWRLSDGFVAVEGKSLLPHVSKFRPNLVLNHTALLVYCLLEAKLLPALVEVIVTSDTFISVRATILLGELLHLSSTLLPPACHGTKVCLPNLVDYITSTGRRSDPLQRHRAAQAASALSKIHRFKKRGIVPHSLALRQIIEMEQRSTGTHQDAAVNGHESETQTNGVPRDASTLNGELGPGDIEMRSNRDPDGILFSLARDCCVLLQKDPLMWNWPVLADLLDWCRLNSLALEESSIRSIARRVIQFYKPSSSNFCLCESGAIRTRLYTTVGCRLLDLLTAVGDDPECDRILADFLDDVSSAVRDITLASSAHDCLLSPGRLANTACQDYFLFIGRLSGTANGINALEKAGIFQDLLELVASTHHDCYLKVIVSTLDYHTDGYARAILKKVMVGQVESGRIYATHQMRVLIRAAAEHGSMSGLAKWAVPVLLNQLRDKCRAVVIAAADILDEATDDPTFIEALIPLHSQLAQTVKDQESQHLDSRGTLLLVKLLSVPAGFKLWSEPIAQPGTDDTSTNRTSLVQLELDKWMNRLNTRYVQLLESDLADGLTHHQRADDGRYGRLSNVRHVIRDLPIPAHLFSQLNQHREGLDFLRTSGQLSHIFSTVLTAAEETGDKEDRILEVKAAVWASAHLGTSEAGVALLESTQVVEALTRLASTSPVMALRGTAFFALNLIAVTSAGVDFLARLGWASIKRHHGELWHVVDDSEWISRPLVHHHPVISFSNTMEKSLLNPSAELNGERDRLRTISQSSGHSVTFASDKEGEGEEAAGPVACMTSTPRRMTATTTSWETDSQPYSLEGSSIHFDSDSDLSSMPGGAEETDRICRRAYTLPPPSSSSQAASGGRNDSTHHFRSFSDSHYPADDDVIVDPLGRGAGALPPASANSSTVSSADRQRREGNGSSGSSSRVRIWTKLRTSLRLRRSKRFSLPSRPLSSSSVASVPHPSVTVKEAPLSQAESEDKAQCPSSSAEETGDDEAEDDGPEDEALLPAPPPPLPQGQQINRIGSILNRLKSVPYKKRRPLGGASATGRYIGLCLPIQLSYLHPPPDWFDRKLSDEEDADFEGELTFNEESTLRRMSYPTFCFTIGEEAHYDHQADGCILCSSSVDPVPTTPSNHSAEEKRLVRKELLRLVSNMGSSVGMNANEQGLLRLKQRFPWAFHDVCLFSDMCQVLASYGYRLRARRFLHELFVDSPFDQLYAVAASRLMRSAGGQEATGSVS